MGGFNWDNYTGTNAGQQGTTADPLQSDYATRLRLSYRQFLGRDASDAEVQDWMTRHPTYTGAVENAIRTSDEAQHYATTGAATPLPAPAPAAGAPAAGAAGSGRGDPEGFRAAWFASGGKTTEDLKNFVAAHPEFGATITGSKGSKLTFPGGQAFQAVRSAGLGGGIGPAWDDISGGGGGGAAGGPGTGTGYMLAPWEREFAAPTAQQALDSPGLQFAINEAQKGLEGSAAARGTLLTGGTLKDLTAQRIGMALQGYGDVYQRAMGEYTNSRTNFYNNQDRPYAKLSGLASLGAGAANQSGQFGTDYGSGAATSIYGAGNAGAAGSIAQGDIWGNYLNNLGRR